MPALRPPLADIIQVMREQAQEHHRSSKNLSPTEEEKRRCQEQLVRVRNLKLLVQDVFKQFDLLFKEIDLREQFEAMQKSRKDGAECTASQVGLNLGELQTDSVKSFTDLLYMPEIDKKLITALGDFMLRISDFSHAKNHSKNQRNWSLIVE